MSGIPYAVYRISEGNEGVRETLYLMAAIVRQWRRDSDVIQFARGLIEHVPQKRFRDEIEAIFDWVRDNIRYTLDPNDVETLTLPLTLIDLGHGDCDDMAVLLSTLLEAVGHKTLFKAVALGGSDLSHVYVQTRIGVGWLSLDPTEPFPAGWEPPGITNKFVVNV